MVAAMIVAMSDEATGLEIPADDPRAVELGRAVRGGDVDTIRSFLANDPRLARAELVDRKGGSRTLLHLVADWPGYFPNGPQIVRLLIQAGADPSFRHPVRCNETALHWAASSDDVDVAAALIDGGADIEVPGGSIGTPLANAVGSGCWSPAARGPAACGWRRGWGTGPGWTRSWLPTRRRPAATSTRRSGRPAMAGSAGWPSTSWLTAPTSTPSRSTRSRPHSRPPARPIPGARFSRTGSRSAALPEADAEGRCRAAGEVRRPSDTRGSSRAGCGRKVRCRPRDGQ
jgi:hypothetical protein